MSPRPREYPDGSRSTAIRIPADLLARINAEARAREVSRTRVIVWAIERGLPLLVPLDSPVEKKP